MKDDAISRNLLLEKLEQLDRYDHVADAIFIVEHMPVFGEEWEELTEEERHPEIHRSCWNCAHNGSPDIEMCDKYGCRCDLCEYTECGCRLCESGNEWVERENDDA